MDSWHSRDAGSQNSNSQPSSTSHQTRPDVCKARLGFEDDVRSLGIALPTRAGQVVTLPTNPPGWRSSRTEATRSYNHDAPRGSENDVRSSGIAPSAPHTPPTSPPKWPPQTNYPRRQRASVDEVLSSRIASASPFTPPTSPPNSSRHLDIYISPSRRGLEDGFRSSGISPSKLRTPPTTPPRNESALTSKEKPAGNRNYIKVTSLKAHLGLDVWRCCCIKKDGAPCQMPRSKDTDVQINSQLESMITLTRSSLEFESELEKLVMIVHCNYHRSPNYKESRIETWATVFPDGDGNTEPSFEKQIRKALDQVSTQCIGITTSDKRCKMGIGGQRVQNCSKTIDEIIKPEVYLDDAYLDGFLKILEANMYCHHHINRRPLKYVAQWKLSIFEIRKKGGPKMMPYSTKNNNTLVSQNRGLPAPRSSRPLALDLAQDPAAFWPNTYDRTPFDILSRGNRLADYKSSYHLIQSELKRPLDEIDQQEGYVYLYEVEGNSGFVKLGYTRGPVKVRHQDWTFDCNRVARTLYPISSSSAIPVRNAKRIEALCHAELDHRRIKIYCKGCLKQHIEWFEISPEEAIAVIRKWSNWTATLPYEMPRLRSGVPSLKEEERQKVRDIDRFMKELSLCNGSSEVNLGDVDVEAGLRRDLR
ncbi:T5orf172 domain-containing protein [Cadophora sp. MPI-SDFR-AT-0126]|nr:T5orf172 domain-containing protein [Leotiomycetes sp. MPI-SDFR-AT-0126]